MNKPYIDDQNAGQSCAKCGKNSDCICYLEIEIKQDEYSYYNKRGELETQKLEAVKIYTWKQIEAAKTFNILAGKEGSRNIRLKLVPKECISNSADCPVAIIYPKTNDNRSSNYSYEYDKELKENIAINDGVLEKNKELELNLEAFDHREAAKDGTFKSLTEVRSLKDAVFASSSAKARANKKMYGKQVLVQLLKVICNSDQALPHARYSVEVLECGGKKGSARTIPFKNEEQAATGSDENASEVPTASASSTNSKSLSEAPPKDNRSFTGTINVHPNIRFKANFRAELSFQKFMNEVHNSNPYNIQRVAINDEHEGKLEKSPMAYKLYSGDKRIDTYEWTANNATEFVKEILEFYDDFIPFVSLQKVIDLIVANTGQQSSARASMVPFKIMPAIPYLDLGGTASMRQKKDGNYYLMKTGRLAADPIIGFNLKLDVITLLINAVPGGTVLGAYLRNKLQANEDAYKNGTSRFYINGKAEMTFSAGLSVGVSVTNEANEGKAIALNFLEDDCKATLGFNFNGKIEGGINLAKIKGCFEMELDIDAKAHLAFKTTKDNGCDLVFYHEGMRMRGTFKARIWTVRTILSGKVNFDERVEYRTAPMDKETSKWKINLVSGDANIPAKDPWTNVYNLTPENMNPWQGGGQGLFPSGMFK